MGAFKAGDEAVVREAVLTSGGAGPKGGGGGAGGNAAAGGAGGDGGGGGGGDDTLNGGNGGDGTEWSPNIGAGGVAAELGIVPLLEAEVDMPAAEAVAVSPVPPRPIAEVKTG